MTTLEQQIAALERRVAATASALDAALLDQEDTRAARSELAQVESELNAAQTELAQQRREVEQAVAASVAARAAILMDQAHTGLESLLSAYPIPELPL